MKFSESTANKSYRTATSSLDDLGLRKDEIPQPLLVALKNPYARSPNTTCVQSLEEIALLDSILGPDIEPEASDKPTSPVMINADGVSLDTEALNVNEDKIFKAGEKILSVGEDFAQDAVVGFIRAQTSFLPFRSMIRQVTGANAHNKKIARAQEAGKLRRAYLKGTIQAMNQGKCNHPILKPMPVIQEARAESHTNQ